MVRSDESACEGEEIVSSELRWYGNAGGQGCACQWRAGGGLLLPLQGWVGGHERSRTLHVMHLLW